MTIPKLVNNGILHSRAQKKDVCDASMIDTSNSISWVLHQHSAREIGKLIHNFSNENSSQIFLVHCAGKLKRAFINENVGTHDGVAQFFAKKEDTAPVCIRVVHLHPDIERLRSIDAVSGAC